MKKQTKLFSIRILAAFLTLALLPGMTGFSEILTANASDPGAELVIASLYGGNINEEGDPAGGGLPVSHSYVEIYNRSGGAINLDDYSLYYMPFPSNDPLADNRPANWYELDLPDITLPAYCSFLIRGNAAAGTTDPTVVLDDPGSYDYAWQSAPDMSTKGGKFFLRSGHGDIAKSVVNPFTDASLSSTYVDMIGWSGNDSGENDQIDGFEGTGITSAALQTSKQRSIYRKNRDIDTDVNESDFAYSDMRASNNPSPDSFPRKMSDGEYAYVSGGEHPALNVNSINGKLTYLGNYSTGDSNADGGIAEIVKYNKENQCMYMVNGYLQSVDIVSIADADTSSKTEFTLKKRLDFAAMGTANGFSFGDITSVAVNNDLDIIAVAVQHEDFTQNGCVVLLDYDGNYIRHLSAGVQPDMLTFSPDNRYCLTANEGEPRDGYEPGDIDPKGSVTIIDLSAGISSASVVTVDFTSFDSTRAELIAGNILIKPDSLPSTDFEPEYIAVSADSSKAYVTLQEANAIAALDIASKSFTGIKGLGFKDHSLPGNELDALNNGRASLSNQDLYGVYMPDGCATVNIGGVDYILTANEGDAREWDEYEDTGSYIFPDEKKIDIIINSERDGLNPSKNYIYGGRSFSIWNAETMTQVFDSGSDFEALTAKWYETCFNSGHDSVKLDGRSGKKGPEPEEVQVFTIGSKIYALIALERIGGMMMYDITDPANASFYDYINLRDFSDGAVSTSGSLGPEGICTIPALDSPTGYPMVLAANEVSGNVDVLQVNEGYEEKIVTPTPEEKTPQTGDNAPLISPAVASVVSIVIWAALGAKGKKLSVR